MTSGIPEWAQAIPSAPVHQEQPNELTRPFTAQQLIEFGEQLIEQFLRRVVLAVVGSFIPGEGSFEQLEEWAHSIPIIGDIITFIKNTTGIDLTHPETLAESIKDFFLGPNSPLNAGNLFGALFPGLLTNINTGALTNQQPNLLPQPKFVPGSIVDTSEWAIFPGSSRSPDGSGCARITADGRPHALRSGRSPEDKITVAAKQKFKATIYVRHTGYTGTGSTVQLQAVPFNVAGVALPPVTLDTYAPTVTNVDWPGKQLSGEYVIPDGVVAVQVRVFVTAGALTGTIDFDDGFAGQGQQSGLFDIGWVEGLSGTLTDIQGRAQLLISGMFNALTGQNSIFAQLQELLQALQSIPFGNVTGVGGPADIGKSIQEFFNHLVGGLLGGILGDGDNDPADVLNAANGVSTNAGLGADAWDLLGIRNNKPLFTGFLPSGTSNYNITDVAFSSSPPTIAATQSASVISIERFEESKPIGVVSWLGYGLTDLTAFYVNLWKISATDGSWTLLHHSPNILGDLEPGSGSPVFQFYVLDEAVPTSPGDDIARELVPVGTGTHTVVGRVTWLPNHPYAQAVSFAAKRDNSSSPNTPPSTIAKASVVRSANVPWIETAINTGIDVSNHANKERYLATAQTVPIPKWCNYVDVVAVGAGGGGHAGATFGIFGEGGNSGKFATTTWWRDEHYTGDAVITFTPGEGGAGGSVVIGAGATGGDTTVSVPGHTLTAEGGMGGQQLQGPGGRTRGIGPGPFTFKDWTITAGSDQNAFGGVGTSPGGGAGGGDWLLLSPGGKGGRGGAWLRFRQNALVDEPSGDITPPTAPTLTAGEIAYSRITVTASGATDNVEVVGYTFFVNGERAAQWQAGTTFTYTGLSSGHEYTLTATARDLAGNESPASADLVVTTLAYGDPLDEEMSLADRNAIDAIVAQCMSEMPLTPGLAIDITGPTGFYRKAYGFANNTKTEPYTLDLHTRVGSSTKAMTAHGVLILADRGLIDLDDLIYPYVYESRLNTWMPHIPNLQEVTIRQLLTMRSGLWEFQKDTLTAMFTVAMPTLPYTYDNLVINCSQAGRPASFAPGEDYEYCNTNFYHLGRLIERVSGKSYAQFLKDELFDPLGMAETSYPATAYLPSPFARGYLPYADPIFQTPGQMDVTTFGPGYIGGAGGVVSTPGDLQKWGQELRDGALLLPETHADLFDLSTFSSDAQGNNADVPARYGYGKGLYSYGSWFGHAGNINGFDSVVHYEKNSGAVIAGTANFNDFAMFIKVFPRIATYLYPGSMVAPEYNPEYAAKKGHS